LKGKRKVKGREVDERKRMRGNRGKSKKRREIK
jgi:hypothetical protein